MSRYNLGLSDTAVKNLNKYSNQTFKKENLSEIVNYIGINIVPDLFSCIDCGGSFENVKLSGGGSFDRCKSCGVKKGEEKIK